MKLILLNLIMNNQILKNITIPKGASFSECGQSISGEWEDCSNLGLINNVNGYTGEFRMAPLGNVAAFASPSFVSCDGPTVEKKDCVIELKFNQDQVRLLIDKQVPIESLLQPPVVNSSGLISTTQNLESSMSSPSVTKTTTQPSECDSIFECSLDFVAANGSIILLTGYFISLVLFKINYTDSSLLMIEPSCPGNLVARLLRILLHACPNQLNRFRPAILSIVWIP